MKTHAATRFWLLLLFNYLKLLTILYVQGTYRKLSEGNKDKSYKYRSHLFNHLSYSSPTWSHLILTFLWVGWPGSTLTVRLQYGLYYSQHFPEEETVAHRVQLIKEQVIKDWSYDLGPKSRTSDSHSCYLPLHLKPQKQGFPLCFQTTEQSSQTLGQSARVEKSSGSEGMGRMGRILTHCSWIGGNVF